MSEKNEITPTKDDIVDEFPWMKMFIILQMVLIVGLLNPWVNVLNWVASVVICIEILATLFWALPIFLYQLVIKRCSWSKSLRIAVKSIIDVLSCA